MVNFRKGKLNKKGMTLAELLVVIGIIVVLIAIAIPSAFMIRKSLRQTELDGKAEIIYTAVQNRLTKMRSAGIDALYKPAGPASSDPAKSIYIIEGIPGDSEDITLDNKIFYTSSQFASSPVSAAAALMNEEVTEPELLSNNWVIEYNPESGLVYAVYYSESETDCAASYADASHVITREYNDRLRVRSNRLRDGAQVGYYGGSNSRVSGSSQIKHTVEITNGQKLSAVIKSTLPVGFNSDSLLFKVTLSDGLGNSYTSYYSDIIRPDITGSDGTLYHVNVPGLSEDKEYAISRIGRLYTLDLTFDSLEDDSLRFDSLYGVSSGHNHDIYGNNANEELVCGSLLKVEVEVTCPEDKILSASTKSSNITNSLFADESNDLKDEAGNNSVAVIKNARHLQNLDSLSNVSGSITDALQLDNIEFAADDENGFNSTYKDGFFNGTEEGKPIFKPISNANLLSYKGRITDPESHFAYGALIEGLFITENGINNKNGKLGLFGEIDLTGREVTLSDLAFTGAKVVSRTNSASSGALIGSVTGNGRLYVINVGSYLTFDDYNGKTNKDIWISGKNAGGLIGLAKDCDISLAQCFAGSVIAGDMNSSSIGGLMGRAEGTRVGISASYADTYLKGAYNGGLIGLSDSDVVIDSCYSAGFETYSAAGAGLVCGKTDKITHSYTIISKLDEDIDAPYFALAESGSAEHAYYVVNGSGVKGTGEITKNMPVKSLLAGLESSRFTIDEASDNTRAYNLMEGQELNTYEYPRINGLIHYCDWEASFRQGAVVYFEHYEDDSWGFAGGDISTLKNDPSLKAAGDGYAIAFTEKIASDMKVELTDPSSGKKLADVVIKADTEPEEVKVNDEEIYYVYPFDAQVVNADYDCDDFFIKAVIDANADEAYYFNPYFARTSKRGTPDKTPSLPREIFIRSARNLYSLSEYYNGYAEMSSGIRFVQEKDIDYASYNWAEYYDSSVSVISRQRPIGVSDGGEVTAFAAVYDGQKHVISNISFASAASDSIGMFAENAGTIANVILYSKANVSNYFAKTASSENRSVYLGALCGYNDGVITNCAVSGYSLNTNETTILGYSNSKIHVGGLAGYNSENGKITNCSADTPEIRISSLYASVMAGGLTGTNAGIISGSYAIGYIDIAEARGGQVSIAGFTAQNSGSVDGSYCAVALVASGESSSSYGFAPKGGAVNRCSYLNAGTYSYNGKTFAYNADTSLSAGTSVKYAELASQSPDGTAARDYGNHAAGTVYPFKGAVTGYEGTLIHYGSWPDKLSFGESGMFYWEHEVGGPNEGYHLTFLGIEAKGTALKAIGGTTLCTSHDDGGVILESGYGYFTTFGEMDNAKVKWTDIQPGAFNSEAAAQLTKQMPEYSFMPYTVIDTDEVIGGNKSSGNHMFLERNVTEGKLEIRLTTDEYDYAHTYAIAPYFANAMRYESTTDSEGRSAAVDTSGAAITGLDGRTTSYCVKAGSSPENAYEIRSARQLQLINWNYKSQNATTSVHDYVGVTETNTNTRYNAFRLAVEYYPYLGSFSNDKKSNTKKFIWLQTHDVDNQNRLFTPVGSLAEASVINQSANLCTAQFDGTYDGQSYKIKNIEISSSGQAVGLFSVTMGAALKNIILYSDNGNVIKANNQGIGWYSIGGLVGFAANGTAANGYGSSEITNCAVSGYTIVDERTNVIANAGDYSFGGANIGGLAGVAVMNISNCEAVNDFVIRASYRSSVSNRFIRVGGLVGNCKAAVSDCYTGGSMTSEMTSAASRINVYFSGVVGGNFIRTAGNMNEVVGATGDSIVKNCYSYMLLPEKNDSAKMIGGRSPIANSPDGGSVARMTITNCYYYDKNANGANSKSTNTTGTATSLKYDEMKDDSFVSKLGGSWSKVSVVDAGGAAIDGKYSFPGNAWELYGKNYPFPTVLKQTDLTFSTAVSPIYVNVHYGKWAIAGLYWEKGRDSMDIFADLDECASSKGYESGYAFKEFKLYDIENETDGHLTEKDADGAYKYLSCQNSEIAQIAGIEYDAQKHVYIVLVKALKDGAVKIEAKYQADKLSQAAFDLEITAKLKVSAANDKEGTDIIEKPVIVEKSDKPDTTIYLLAQSPVAASQDQDSQPGPEQAAKAKDVSKLVSWTVTPDISDVVTYSLKDNACKLTRDDHGIIILTAKAEYDYHGVKYSASAFITVSEPGVIGISSGKKYNEALIAETAGIYEGKASSYGANAPMTGALAFLYSSVDNDFLSGAEIDNISVKYDGSIFTSASIMQEDLVTLTCEGREEVFKIRITPSSDDGRYQYKNIELYAEGKSELPDKISAEVCVQISGAFGDTYTVSIPVNGISSRVNNKIVYMSSYDEMVSYETSAWTHEDTLIEDAESLGFEREGYTFAGWALEEDAKEAALTGGQIIDIATLSSKAEEGVLTLYAVWKENSYSVSFDANGAEGFMDDQTFKFSEEKALAGNAFANEGKEFIGWATSIEEAEDGEVIFAEGEIVSKLSSQNGSKVTLYAVWRESESESESE